MRYWTLAVLRTTALCTVVGSSFAQTPPASLPQGALEDVVVVANRMPEPLVRVGSSVTVITADEIEASQAAVVSDLLAETPGLTVVRNGGVGQPTSVFIRGADSAQTVVLIDGVQLNDPSSPSGGYDFGNLLMGDIARIEILRGAQSTLYGSQAIGGVVSITTADPTSPLGGGLSAEGGSRDTGYFTGDLGGKSDALTWRIAGNYLTTDGISAFDKAFGGKELDGSKLGGFSGRLRYDFTPDVQLDLRGYYTHARTDFDGYDTPTGAFGDDNEYGIISQYTEYAGLNFKGLDGQLTNRIAFQASDSDRKSFDPNVGPITETFYGIGRNNRWEYQGTWNPAGGLQAVFGLQRERTTIVTDTPAYDVTPMPLNSEATIDSAYLQLQDELFKGFTLTTGVRYDKHDVFGSHTTGQGAIAWALNDGTTILRASVGEGFKAPALYQLFSPYGNLALQPEEATSWDAGIEQHMLGGHVIASATYFSRRSRDLIEFFDCSTSEPLCGSEPFGYYANIARASARGVEAQLSYAPVPNLALALNYTYTDATDRSPGASTYGNELPRRPKSSGNASAAYRWPGNFTTTVVVRYAGQSFDDAANLIPLSSYALVDFRLSYAITDRLEAYGRIENATNKQYETAYQYGQNGRGEFVGARLTFCASPGRRRQAGCRHRRAGGGGAAPAVFQRRRCALHPHRNGRFRNGRDAERCGEGGAAESSLFGPQAVMRRIRFDLGRLAFAGYAEFQSIGDDIAHRANRGIERGAFLRRGPRRLGPDVRGTRVAAGDAARCPVRLAPPRFAVRCFAEHQVERDNRPILLDRLVRGVSGERNLARARVVGHRKCARAVLGRFKAARRGPRGRGGHGGGQEPQQGTCPPSGRSRRPLTHGNRSVMTGPTGRSDRPRPSQR